MASTTKTLFSFTRIVCSIFIGTAFYLTGLAQLDAQPSAKPGLSKEKQTTLLEKTANPDATRVAQAIALSLTGGADRSLKPQVRFATPNASPASDPVIARNGLKLVGVAITESEKQGADQNGRRVRGMIAHSDGYSRFMYTHFQADYGLTGETIIIESTTVKAVEPARPRVALFFVPANKVPRDIAKTRPYATILEFAIKNAVDVQGNKKIDKTIKDYYVFAFFMERLAPDAKTGLLISDRPDGLSGHCKGITRFQQDGWHGAFMPTTFAIDSSPERFFKVLFQPGSYTPEKQRQPKLVGVFTTASTVTLVQRALAQNGYDPGPADGLMGMRTRRAIRKFQQDHGLKVDGESSVALLAALTGAGQLPSTTEIEGLSGTSNKSAASSTSVWNRLKPKMWPNKIQRP
jgi:hypothetical protein